jgi:hypothetical protein
MAVFMGAVMFRYVSAGNPHATERNGEKIYYTVDHGRRTEITVDRYYGLLASLPAAEVLLQVHFLLYHRWWCERLRRRERHQTE